MRTFQSIPDSQGQVKLQAVSPSLVDKCQSGTWDRRQRRTFQRLKSWCTFTVARGYQLLRVDLTSSSESGANTLVADFKRLRRSAEKKFKGYSVEFFKVQTYEGHGVLHMVWAIKWDHAVWISQVWLSDEWARIHGAPVVFIRRMGSRKRGYLAEQYLAGQSAIVRVSWSWWRTGLAIGGAWKLFCKECWKMDQGHTWTGTNEGVETLGYRDMIRGWEQVLSRGHWEYGGVIFFLSGRTIDMVYSWKVDREVRFIYQS
jgi:hypothetical protein